ncbi:hypothetical protein CEXT_227361 [Caerostris extrusa]|uniref:Uncharacterized protein n=1 Tax=Caerostris extrusa TaxID=172846 RepID=A0AAV4XMZ5_CAEEX|nr:hypothetical protein CEXT_227361 [Caerostris extrusa]
MESIQCPQTLTPELLYKLKHLDFIQKTFYWALLHSNEVMRVDNLDQCVEVKKGLISSGSIKQQKQKAPSPAQPGGELKKPHSELDFRTFPGEGLLI